MDDRPVGESGDHYEQEADQVAAKVVSRINAPATVQRQKFQAPPASRLSSLPTAPGAEVTLINKDLDAINASVILKILAALKISKEDLSSAVMLKVIVKSGIYTHINDRLVKKSGA